MNAGHRTRTLDEQFGLLTFLPTLSEQIVQPLSEFANTLLKESGRKDPMFHAQLHQRARVPAYTAEIDPVLSYPLFVLGVRDDRASVPVRHEALAERDVGLHIASTADREAEYPHRRRSAVGCGHIDDLGEEVDRIRGHDRFVGRCALDHKCRGGVDRTVRFFDRRRFRRSPRFFGHDDPFDFFERQVSLLLVVELEQDVGVSADVERHTPDVPTECARRFATLEVGDGDLELDICEQAWSASPETEVFFGDAQGAGVRDRAHDICFDDCGYRR